MCVFEHPQPSAKDCFSPPAHLASLLFELSPLTPSDLAHMFMLENLITETHLCRAMGKNVNYDEYQIQLEWLLSIS